MSKSSVSRAHANGNASSDNDGNAETKDERGIENRAVKTSENINPTSMRFEAHGNGDEGANLRTTSSLTQTFKQVSHGSVDMIKWRASYRVRVKRKRNLIACIGRYRIQERPEDEYRNILDDVVGEVHTGQLLAIMGPSGSGKTSLLNVIAGRVPVGGEIAGDVFVDGLKRKEWRMKPSRSSEKVLSNQLQKFNFSHVTAYVQQDDILFPTLTVEETFTFAAQMRLPRALPASMKENIKNVIINELGLRKTLHTLVGGSHAGADLKGGRGISGGERKRVNIGVEMIRLPSVLFLDEPTSGLDSFQAQSIVETLITLARHGRIVISTIHQPRSSIYEMFDRLLLLNDSGRNAYFGPAYSATDWFREIGSEFVCPIHFNPADFFLDMIATDYRTVESEKHSKKRIEKIVQHFRETNELYSESERRNLQIDSSSDNETLNSFPLKYASEANCVGSEKNVELADTNDRDIRDDKAMNFSIDTSGIVFRKHVYGANWPTQLWYLYLRQLKVVMRSKGPLIINGIQSVFFAVLLGLLYMDMGRSYQSVTDRTGLLFFSLINVSLGGIFMVLSVFPKEKQIVMRERDGKTYNISSYYLAKYFSDLPMRLGIGLIYGSIVYWIAGLNSGFSNFVVFLVVLVLTRLTGEAIGIFVSAAMPTIELAQALAPFFVIMFLLFGGFYINQESMPEGAKWVKYCSYFYWGFTALARNEFIGETFGCPPSELSPNCVFTGEEQLTLLGFDQYSTAESIIALILIQICFHCFAYLSLRFIKTRYISV